MARPRRLARRRLAVGLCAALAVLGLTGCGESGFDGGGQYAIAGGNPSGIYFNYADRLAAAVHEDLGLDIVALQTEGSVENLELVASGDALLGFAQGDTAADAQLGIGSFDEPLDVRAVAKVYDEFVHVVVPATSELHSLSDLDGTTLSLGAENSGVQVIAARLLEAAGVDSHTVTRRGLGIDESIAALAHGEIDAFFWVGGIPTPGIEELAERLPIRLLSIDADVVDRVNEGHAGVYQLADFPVGFYGFADQVVTMTVPNYLVTDEAAPDDLIRSVTRILFESRVETAASVTAAGYLDRRLAIFTGPITLHPGAAQYYVDNRR